jgi:hypothetical protein
MSNGKNPFPQPPEPSWIERPPAACAALLPDDRKIYNITESHPKFFRQNHARCASSSFSQETNRKNMPPIPRRNSKLVPTTPKS